MNKPFKFKQFTIHQDRCAMKVGTDGVLLGAWTSLENHPNSILDIGAGTGLIALQLAQRSNSETIDAIELDEDAYEQCVENFEASDWGDRLFCYHASLQEFTEELDESYDLIVSNPPFYESPLAPPKGQDKIPNNRKKARFNNSLPFNELLSSVAKLLSKNGEFVIIVPFKEEKRLIALAQDKDLTPHRITRVKGTSASTIKRSLLQFSYQKATTTINELVIEINRHEYTLEYKELTKDFYLKM